MSGREKEFIYSLNVTVAGSDGFAGSESFTNFRTTLGPALQRIGRVSIVSVTFPNNAYNVNDTGGGANNEFAITIDGKTTSYEVEGGFYTTTTLMAAVEAAIQATMTALGDGQTFTLAQDSITQKVTATYGAGTSGVTSVTLVDPAINSGIWYLLGFTTIPATVTTTLTAPSLPSLGGLKEVLLQSNTFAPGKMISSTQDTQGWKQQNALVAIPITSAFGVSNVWECKQDVLCEISYLQQKTLQDADFYLTDRQGNIVDLHGGNLVINLRVWFNRY